MSTLAILPLFLRNEKDMGLARQTVRSMNKTAPSLRCVVVDDCSPAQNLVEELDEDLLACGYSLRRQPSNEGFARTVNVGLREALDRGDDGLLVNSDIFFFQDGWFEAMTAREESVVGARLLYANGLIQHAGIYYSIISRSFDHIHKFAPHNLELANLPRYCPVTGALQLIRHECLTNVGVYDENFRLGWEDVDYCHQVFQSGRQCVYEPKAVAIHYESMTRGKNPTKRIEDWTKESWSYLHKKHRGHDFSTYVPTMLMDGMDDDG